MKAGAEGVRRHNRALVLRLLATGGPRSWADLAVATGLTKATVSAIVGDLETDGWVRDTGAPVAGRPGRPATLVEIGDRHLSVGLVIDVDHVGLSVTDLTGKVVAEARRAVDNGRSRPATAMARLTRLARPALDGLRARGHLLDGGIVAVPGLVDPVTGLVVIAPNLGWSEVEVAPGLSEALDVEVRAANEADLAGEAEIVHGWGRTYRDFFLVSAGVGVGAGVVIGGEVFRGAHGFGGELGHFVVDPGGPACRCGNRGCLERYVGQRDLPPAIAPDGGDWPESVVRSARAGDTVVLGALEGVAERLAQGLVAAVHLVDPEAVVLGGWLAGVAPWVAPTIAAHLRDHVLGARWAPRAVVASVLGRDAALDGAAVAGARQLIDR